MLIYFTSFSDFDKTKPHHTLYIPLHFIELRCLFSHITNNNIFSFSLPSNKARKKNNSEVCECLRMPHCGRAKQKRKMKVIWRFTRASNKLYHLTFLCCTRIKCFVMEQRKQKSFVFCYMFIFNRFLNVYSSIIVKAKTNFKRKQNNNKR